MRSCTNVCVLRVAEELADPGSALVVKEHQNVEEHGTRRGTDRVEAVAELALDVFEIHGLLDTSFGTPAE